MESNSGEQLRDRRSIVRILTVGSGLLLTGTAACTGQSATDSESAETPGDGERIPDPTNVLITRWRADHYALGSYSYLAKGSEPDDRETLASTLGDRVFFAGEATSTSYPSTVHGALLSGREAASAIASIAKPGARVAVIGAGAAGIAGARQLVDDGFQVVIYEAQSRIGGRIRTDSSLGYPVDLGASWIHGADGNPLTTIADEIDAPRVRTDYDSVLVYDHDGTRIDRDIWSGASRAVRGAFQRELSLEEAVAGRVEGRHESIVRSTNFAVVAAYEHEYAADIASLSSFAPHEGEEFPGPDVFLPEGYLSLLDTLTDGLDIQLDTSVERIDWQSASPQVTTSAGVSTHDHVLVTLPLGLLKAGRVVFSPELPTQKLEAIARLGMGLLNKVVLEFPERFWDWATDSVGYVSKDRGRWAQWYDLTDVTGKPTIFCFHAGSVAEQIEGMTDEAVIDEAMAVLRTIYEN